jgi:hypothetical protein
MEEQKTPEQVLNSVNQHTLALAETDNECERGYAQLGWMLLEVATMQYWRVSHTTFRDYLRTLAMLSKRTVGQLHQYFLTVRDLSDTFTISQIESMGITKAIKLRAAKYYAIVLPQAIVTAALDPKVTVKELQKVISTTLKMPDEEGDWMDLEMEFMVTAEQRELFEQVIDIAMRTEPLTKSTISKSAQMADVMTKLAQEYLGAHCGDGN